jgi:hypothetical protein
MKYPAVGSCLGFLPENSARWLRSGVGLVTLGSALALGVSRPAVGQEYYEDQVTDQLEAAAMVVGLDGYEMMYDPYVDRTGEGMSDTLTFTLYEGVSYTIIGVCDEDCTDLDLELFDGNGNSIDSDYATDDIPIVEVTPAWDSKFSLQINMATCSNEPCYYGVGVFGD